MSNMLQSALLAAFISVSMWFGFSIAFGSPAKPTLIAGPIFFAFTFGVTFAIGKLVANAKAKNAA